MHFFCPLCWEEIDENATVYHHCKAWIAELDNEPFVRKLIRDTASSWISNGTKGDLYPGRKTYPGDFKVFNGDAERIGWSLYSESADNVFM